LWFSEIAGYDKMHFTFQPDQRGVLALKKLFSFWAFTAYINPSHKAISYIK
jgi:hypothetical protein